MAEKQKKKFSNFRIAEAPTDTSKYDCISGTGRWYLADRNTEVPSDRQGWGAKDVLVYVEDGNSKVCAPEPPFSGDGPWSSFIQQVQYFFSHRN